MSVVSKLIFFSIIEPNIPYHMHSGHGSHGYCIIINNSVSNEIMQFEEIQSVLGKEMELQLK